MHTFPHHQRGLSLAAVHAPHPPTKELHDTRVHNPLFQECLCERSQNSLLERVTIATAPQLMDSLHGGLPPVSLSVPLLLSAWQQQEEMGGAW